MPKITVNGNEIIYRVDHATRSSCHHRPMANLILTVKICGDEITGENFSGYEAEKVCDQIEKIINSYENN